MRANGRRLLCSIEIPLLASQTSLGSCPKFSRLNKACFLIRLFSLGTRRQTSRQRRHFAMPCRHVQGMDAAQARAAVIAAEKEHGLRRDWLWSRMGCSPLAGALAHLFEVAQRSATAPIGQTPTELADSYQQSGWQVDHAAMAGTGMRTCKSGSGGRERRASRDVFTVRLEEAARRLQTAVKNNWWLAPNLWSFGRRRCRHLHSICGWIALRLGCAAAATGLPPSVRRRCLHVGPVCHPSPLLERRGARRFTTHIAGTPDDGEFEPRVKADGRPLSSHNFKNY